MLTELPRDLSFQMANCLMAREGPLTKGWYYDYGVVWRGMEQLDRRSHGTQYFSYIQDAVDTLVDAQGQIRGYRMDAYNLDSICDGRQLLFLHEKLGDERYLRAAATLREQLRHQPRNEDGGFWHKQCYPHQMWLDGLHMAMPFYVEYALRTGEGDETLKDAALQFTLAYRHTFDPTTGLNRHGFDMSRKQAWADPQTGQSAHAWGRAMGWYLLGLADTLEIMAQYGKTSAALTDIFTSMADQLLRVREEGVWLQVLDCAGRVGNYHESSATFLILCALFKGVRLGLLSDETGLEAQKSYESAIARFVGRMRDGRVFVAKCCQGAGLGGSVYRDGSFDYYISEPVTAFDLKATGAMIQAACEYEQMKKEQPS